MSHKGSSTILGTNGRPITIDYRYNIVDFPAPIIIFAHGFKGFKDWGPFNLVADFFAEHGAIFVKFNFSHNGTTIDNLKETNDLEAFAENTISKELEDITCVIDWATTTLLNNLPSNVKTLPGVMLIGFSMGGAISLIQASKDNRIQKLSTWASTCNFYNLLGKENIEKLRSGETIYIENKRTNQLMPIHKSFIDDLDDHEEEYNLLRVARRVPCPWRIFHGYADESVPFECAIKLQSVGTLRQMILLDNAGHTFGGTHPYTSNQLPTHLEIVALSTLGFFMLGNE